MKKNDAGYGITVNSNEGGYTVFWNDEDAYELPAIEQVLFLDPFMSPDMIQKLDAPVEISDEMEAFITKALKTGVAEIKEDVLKATRDVVEGR